MCLNFKTVKAMEKIFRTYVDLSLLKICAEFLGKKTEKKQVRGKNYDRHCNNSFHQKLESVKYDAALAITAL